MENSYIKTVIKEQVKEAKEKGVSMANICREIGISQQAYYQYLNSDNGSHTITEKLIKYFNLKLIKIF